MKQKGFTLIEVIISIGILLGATITVSLIWSGNATRIQKIKLYNNITTLLEQKTIELELKYENAPFGEIPEELSGDFGSDHPDYSWEFKTQEFEMPDIKELYSAGSEESFMNETLVMVLNQMKEYLSNTVKEATITVKTTVRKKPVKFSVSTYFVDYTQAFTLGGASPASGSGGSP